MEEDTEEPKRKRGRPKGSVQPIDYEKVATLARVQCTQQEIAREIGMSEENFSRRMQTDQVLQEAMQGAVVKGKISVRHQMYRAMMDRYMTICKDCGHIEISLNDFSAECRNPQCPSHQPFQPEDKPLQGVEHKFLGGDHSLMIFWSKNYLNMSDRVMLQGDEKAPIAIKNLTDEELDKRLDRLTAILSKAGKSK